jgi:hypothetical protein
MVILFISINTLYAFVSKTKYDIEKCILYDYDDDAITVKAAEYTSSGKKTKPAFCAAD